MLEPCTSGTATHRRRESARPSRKRAPNADRAAPLAGCGEHAIEHESMAKRNRSSGPDRPGCGVGRGVAAAVSAQFRDPRPGPTATGSARVVRIARPNHRATGTTTSEPRPTPRGQAITSNELGGHDSRRTTMTGGLRRLHCLARPGPGADATSVRLQRPVGLAQLRGTRFRTRWRLRRRRSPRRRGTRRRSS
jgi:hypothetical protein